MKISQEIAMKSHDLFAGQSVNHIGEKKCLFLGVMYKMGYFRENLHTKQKTSRKNPSTSYAGSPPLSGEAYFRLP